MALLQRNQSAPPVSPPCHGRMVSPKNELPCSVVGHSITTSLKQFSKLVAMVQTGYEQTWVAEPQGRQFSRLQKLNVVYFKVVPLFTPTNGVSEGEGWTFTPACDSKLRLCFSHIPWLTSWPSMIWRPGKHHAHTLPGKSFCFIALPGLKP